MNHPCYRCATCIVDQRYDPEPCPACSGNLATMKSTNATDRATAKLQWLKWNRTMVNRFKKNQVRIYLPQEVRMLLWKNETQKQSWTPYLPPTPSCRKSPKTTTVVAASPSSIELQQTLERCDDSSWSGFDG